MVVDDVMDAPLYLPLEPVLMADTRSLNTSVTSYTAPVLAAETRDLGGAAYEVLTLGGDPPAGQTRPASWVTGPATGQRGSR
jgi:hypothetical protein